MTTTYHVQYITLKSITQNITCPTLVLEAKKDHSFPGQPKKVYYALDSCPKKYMLFTTEERCQCGTPAISNQHIFDLEN